MKAREGFDKLSPNGVGVSPNGLGSPRQESATRARAQLKTSYIRCRLSGPARPREFSSTIAESVRNKARFTSSCAKP